MCGGRNGDMGRPLGALDVFLQPNARHQYNMMTTSKWGNPIERKLSFSQTPSPIYLQPTSHMGHLHAIMSKLHIPHPTSHISYILATHIPHPTSHMFYIVASPIAHLHAMKSIFHIPHPISHIPHPMSTQTTKRNIKRHETSVTPGSKGARTEKNREKTKSTLPRDIAETKDAKKFRKEIPWC